MIFTNFCPEFIPASKKVLFCIPCTIFFPVYVIKIHFYKVHICSPNSCTVSISMPVCTRLLTSVLAEHGGLGVMARIFFQFQGWWVTKEKGGRWGIWQRFFRVVFSCNLNLLITSSSLLLSSPFSPRCCSAGPSHGCRGHRHAYRYN